MMAQGRTSSHRKAATSPGNNRRKSSPGKERTSPRTASKRSAKAGDGVGRSETAKRSVTKSARTAGHAAESTAKNVGTAAKKNLKTPLIAGGAALGGLAGGWVMAARRSPRPKVLGVAMPRRSNAVSATKNLASAAQQAAVASERLGELATEVRRVREETAKGKRRSPVEVVLEGLTSRRVRA